MRNVILIISSFLLIVGCSTRTPSIKDNANQLRDELTVLSDSIKVNLESDNETINISFEDNILFEFGKYSVKDEFRNTLEILSNFLIKYPDFEITIEGYTDSIGDKYSNLTLSRERALAVASVLIENNISSQRINSIGYGEDNPKYDNDTEEGRSGNRRAEIKLKKYITDKTIEPTDSYNPDEVLIEDNTPIEIIEESEYIQEQNIEAPTNSAKKKRIKKKKVKHRAKHKKVKKVKKKKVKHIVNHKKAKEKQAQIRRQKEAKQRAKQERIQREKKLKQKKAREEQIRKDKEAKDRAEGEKEKSRNSII